MGTQNSLDCEQWLEYARQDKTLAALVREDKEQARNLALCAHQMTEHAIKAVYIYLKHELPPKIHVLPELARLIEGASFAVSEKEKDFLQLLDSYFMPVKYPQAAGALPSYEKAVQLFDEGCKILERIEKELA